MVSQRGLRPLAHIPTRDLIVCFYIVKAGISALRWRAPGVDDIRLIRDELAAREGVAS